MPGTLLAEEQPLTPSLQDNGTGSRVKSLEPVAICGMACRLPGGISTPEELWQFLISKQDGRSRVPASRYNTDGHSSRIPGKPGQTRSDYGYFINDDLQTFDASCFGMSVAELERCDPQQRLMLMAACESIADAGEVGVAGRQVGVYMGVSERGWGDLYEKESQNYGSYNMLGTGDFALSNRISYELDLKGPSMTVRTACASSLSALNEACKAISQGDCESAIVGGASIILGTSMTLQMAEQNALAEDGSCKTFSADANGYARAEAINAIYVKPLSSALRDGNPVRAVIRGIATNHNGRNGGITVPNPSAQMALIKQAYTAAGIDDLSETGFVECHGTGTPKGDPLEAKAVGEAFGSHMKGGGLFIGSVKPNLGHSEGASGLTSLLKAVLALEHKTIPPNIKMGKPNPAIPFDKYNLTVPSEPTPWPKDRKERVSVNNFGIGGANAHVIIDSADSFGATPQLEEAGDNAQLLLFSAKSSGSLQHTMDRYITHLAKSPERIEDVAYTLANRREHMEHRAYLVASREKPGKPSVLSKPPTGPAPNVVMVFTGQGAQWPQMGRNLLRTNNVFKTTIKTLDQQLKLLGENSPSWSIESELKKAARTSNVKLAEFSQPLCTAVQIGLVNALKAVGVEATGVVGHSSGEIAAAYAAGALTAGDAIVAAYYRGVVAKQQIRPGGMAAIGLGPEEVQEFLTSQVGIACENSPRSVTLSGDADKVVEVVDAISKAKPDTLARLLKVDKAYHSYHMVEVGHIYSDLVGPNFEGKHAVKPFFSSVEGRLLTKLDKLDAKYWQKNLESTVRFTEAVSAITRHQVGQNAVYLEVGPHSALAGPLRQILVANSESGGKVPYVAAMLRGQDSTESFLSAIGFLYSLHVPIDFKALYPQGVTLPNLPSYAWNNNRVYWHETRVMREFRDRPFRHHSLLGLRTLESTDFEPQFRNLFHLEAAPWIRDHSINGDVVYPFAAYVAMAGEAIRQISDVQEGFQLRNCTAMTALVVHEDKPVELITAFHRRTLADGSNSRWWDFTISSHNGHVWVQNFSGQATAFSESLGPAEHNHSELPRVVSSEKWYTAVDRTGFSYGSTFQCLENIRAATTQPGRATATIHNKVDDEESYYHIHPTVVDNVFQMLPAAALLGQSRRLGLNVITGIGEISIKRCSEAVAASVKGQIAGNGSLLGNGECTTTGNGAQTVLRMSGTTFSVLGYPDEEDSHAAARHLWRPHVDFVAPEKLLKPARENSRHAAALSEVTDLALQFIKKTLAGSDEGPAFEHLQRYRSWIFAQTDAENFSQLDCDTLLETLKVKCRALQGSEVADVAEAIRMVATSAHEILTAERDGLDLLSEGGLLSKFQAYISEFDNACFLRALAHTQPNLRVLELNAGVGALAAKHLENLESLYSKYTFTDASQRLVAEGKEYFRDQSNVEFALLDIGGDLANYGFADGERQYDLIIATNVLNQKGNIRHILRNIHSLLKPRGRLLLQELTPSVASRWVTLVLGILPSWWLGMAGGPGGNLGIAANVLEETLQAAGFAKPGVVIHDSEPPFQLSNIVIARPAPLEGQYRPKEVAILTTDSSSVDDTLLTEQLVSRGFKISHITLDNEPPTNVDVVSLLDCDAPFLANISSEGYRRLNKFLVALSENQAGLFWITKSSTETSSDPYNGLVVGFARTLRTEIAAQFAVVQTLGGFADTQVGDVFEHFHGRKQNGNMEPEMEYFIDSNAEIKVGRYYPFTLGDELLEISTEEEAILTVGRAGNLDELRWANHVSRAPNSDEVEVEIYAAGLNNKDLSNALGTSGQTEKAAFGLEAAGTVRRSGKGVTDLKIGDRVVLLGRNTLATTVTLPSQLVAKIPSTLSFTDAAALPSTYTTSLYALINVGRLDAGGTVLIHNAVSAFGIAAVQVAKMVDARILATVENDKQAHYLAENFDLQFGTDVFSSDSEDFVGQVHRVTDGSGADVVLNSLMGDLFHASWKCVAECGILIDVSHNALGRGGGSGLEMSPFRDNRTYTAVDLDRLCTKKPALVARHLHSLVELNSQGLLAPLATARVFPASDITAAFTHVREGNGTSKTVVEMRPEAGGPAQISSIVSSRRPVSLHSQGSYMVVGGLGGIGRQVAVWLAEQGAGNLILMSRSAGSSPGDIALVNELQSLGASVQVVKGSVSSLEDVRAAVEGAAYPIRGVVQMSAVLRDRAFAEMSIEDWQEVVTPKVQGTWNLHEATVKAKSPIDFFILFGSITAAVGQPGQANYVAANAFLDAFAHYRHAQGLPAVTIDVGVVEDVGLAANRSGFLSSVKAMGFLTVRERQILDSMALAINYIRKDEIPANFVIGLGSSKPLSSPNNRLFWRNDPRFAVYHSRVAGGAGDGAISSSSGIKAFLTEARNNHELLKSPEAVITIAKEIGRKVLDLLGKPSDDVQTTQGLSDLGMDSLVGIEMRKWWKTTFGFEVSLLEMLGMGTLEVLSRHAVDGLCKLMNVE